MSCRTEFFSCFHWKAEKCYRNSGLVWPVFVSWPRFYWLQQSSQTNTCIHSMCVLGVLLFCLWWVVF